MIDEHLDTHGESAVIEIWACDAPSATTLCASPCKGVARRSILYRIECIADVDSPGSALIMKVINYFVSTPFDRVTGGFQRIFGRPRRPHLDVSL